MGACGVSPQRIALLEAAQHLLLRGMAETARALQCEDGEAASRARTLLSKWAQLIERSVGLDVEAAEPYFAVIPPLRSRALREPATPRGLESR